MKLPFPARSRLNKKQPKRTSGNTARREWSSGSNVAKRSSDACRESAAYRSQGLDRGFTRGQRRKEEVKKKRCDNDELRDSQSARRFVFEN